MWFLNLFKEVLSTIKLSRINEGVEHTYYSFVSVSRYSGQYPEQLLYIFDTEVINLSF